MRLRGKPVTRVENYCATGSEAFRNACYAVASGAYDTAMVTQLVMRVGTPCLIIASLSRTPVSQAVLEQMLLVSIALIVLMLALSIAGAHWYARRTAAPIERLRRKLDDYERNVPPQVRAAPTPRVSGSWHGLDQSGAAVASDILFRKRSASCTRCTPTSSPWKTAPARP